MKTLLLLLAISGIATASDLDYTIQQRIIQQNPSAQFTYGTIQYNQVQANRLQAESNQLQRESNYQQFENSVHERMQEPTGLEENIVQKYSHY